MTRADIRFALPAGLLLLLAASEAQAQTPAPGGRIHAALIGRGFENVSVDPRETAVTVWYENRVFRYDLTAMGVVAYLAAADLDSAAMLELVPLNRGVPVVAVSAPAGSWLAFLNGELDTGGFRAVLRIDAGTRLGGLPLSPRGLPRSNPPYLRTDFQVRPLFDFQLGNGSDPFDYTLRVAPEAVMSPFRGGLITLQAAIRIHDDLNTGSPWIEPERNTLSWGGWLPSQVMAAASGGLFPGNRWGFAGEVNRLFWAGQLELRAGGDVSGLFEFLEDTINYSNLEQWSAFGAATHRFRGLDLETTLTAGRFREEDFVVKFEMARRIQEFEIGFFVATSDFEFNTSPYGGATAAGVNLRFALPVRKYSTPKTFRLSTVPEFPFTYRSTLANVGLQVPLYDNLDRLRKRLYPTYIWNEIDELRTGVRYAGEGGGE